VKSSEYDRFVAAIPDLGYTPLGSQGTCPACGKALLTLKPTGPNTFEPSCAGGCDLRRIVAAVTRIVSNGVTQNGTNGAKEASVASVAKSRKTRRHELARELAPEAYYGLPGKIVRAMAPHTESHDAGVLGSFLAGGGCLIGARPHVYRDAQRHACNEYVLLVGKTGSGRKGTASRRAFEVFNFGSGDTNSTEIDDVDMHERARARGLWDLILRGLGSGEALVAALAEEAEDGTLEPRRLVFEPEFARCLKVMDRQGSILSDILRAGWDSEPMEVRTKGGTLKAHSSHVGMLAHVTEADLRERMSQTELLNGFGNRFLWMGTARSRSLPFGGGEAPIRSLAWEVHEALVASRYLYNVNFDEDASWLWESQEKGGAGIYDLLNQGKPGLLGSVTDRAAPHITRLALQYAIWDRKTAIGVPHLLAGLAVWDYSENTCAALFGESVGDSYADTILERLEEVYPGFLTRKEMRDLFSRHAAPGRIPMALELLEDLGMIERRKMETEGRSAEIVAVTVTKHRDLSDRSPLAVAREAAKSRGYMTNREG
jgi:hypothetical protein